MKTKPYRVQLDREPFYRDFRTQSGAMRVARREVAAGHLASVLDRTGVPKYIAHLKPNADKKRGNQ